MASRTAFRTCPLCEAVCGLRLRIDDDVITEVRGDPDDPFSRGYLCPKGASLGRLDADPDRLDAPLLRGDAGHAETSWEEAFRHVHARLRDILDRHGNDAVAVYIGNPAAHSIAGPLYAPALVKALRTRNVYTASTADQMPKHVSSGHLFGDPTAIPVPDLDRTDHLLMFGANPLETNGSLCSAPDFPKRLRAVRARGGTVTVVDPRRTRTADLADEHVFLRPGTDAFLLAALVQVLFAEDLVAAPPALPDRLNGLDDVRALVRDLTPERVARVTGVEPATTRRLARALAAAPRAAVYGRLGTTVQAFGTLSSWLVDVLNIVTGNLDRPGGAMFARAAHRSLHRLRRPFAPGRWHSRVRGLPETMGELPVATLADEIETPGEGRVRALITIGGNPALSAPNAARLDRALGTLDFMVSVDPYLNETTRHAHVVLPPPRPRQTPHYDVALLGLAVRNYARYSPPVVAPPAGRPGEAAILARLAVTASGLDAAPGDLDEMIIADTLRKAVALPGSPVHGRDPGELRKALADGTLTEQRLDMMLRLGPYGDGFGDDPSGLTLARLRDEHPHGIDLGPLEPRLDEVLCTASGRIELCPPAFAADTGRLRAALDAAPADPGLVLIGRRHLRSNNSWMHNVPELTGGSNTCTLQLSTADAGRLGVTAGARVRVTARTGTVEAVAEPTDRLMPGVVSLPHGWGHDRPGTRTRVASADPGVSVNTLTDEREIDPLSGTAVLNGVPVTVEPIA
ncbi:molybdopterin-dependent oxidoreductase [Actinomadura rayongensis]|uniref:Molybdopterin-dependent oxidoreductase n=1 Tax=Actinomadura rayongensis TaxID=1429076 RepID=A0A6I4W8A5_9ACTN|nr:molybdopterin-dependent oxidoreductase [Actinomadura rayongensis]MXQ66959.1 molybdopterin-dependent oxidoreductase [Actinomadura rayongensis]